MKTEQQTRMEHNLYTFLRQVAYQHGEFKDWYELYERWSANEPKLEPGQHMYLVFAHNKKANVVHRTSIQPRDENSQLQEALLDETLSAVVFNDLNNNAHDQQIHDFVEKWAGFLGGNASREGISESLTVPSAKREEYERLRSSKPTIDRYINEQKRKEQNLEKLLHGALKHSKVYWSEIAWRTKAGITVAPKTIQIIRDEWQFRQSASEETVSRWKAITEEIANDPSFVNQTFTFRMMAASTFFMEGRRGRFDQWESR